LQSIGEKPISSVCSHRWVLIHSQGVRKNEATLVEGRALAYAVGAVAYNHRTSERTTSRQLVNRGDLLLLTLDLGASISHHLLSIFLKSGSSIDVIWMLRSGSRGLAVS
jgi:hypothetical protein